MSWRGRPSIESQLGRSVENFPPLTWLSPPRRRWNWGAFLDRALMGLFAAAVIGLSIYVFALAFAFWAN